MTSIIVSFIDEYCFSIGADPWIVASKPYTGVIRVNPGSIHKYAKPKVLIFAIGCRICSKNTAVSSSSKDIDIAKPRSHRLNP